MLKKTVPVPVSNADFHLFVDIRLDSFIRWSKRPHKHHRRGKSATSTREVRSGSNMVAATRGKLELTRRAGIPGPARCVEQEVSTSGLLNGKKILDFVC